MTYPVKLSAFPNTDGESGHTITYPLLTHWSGNFSNKKLTTKAILNCTIGKRDAAIYKFSL